jgi:hypothetical protein
MTAGRSSCGVPFGLKSWSMAQSEGALMVPGPLDVGNYVGWRSFEYRLGALLSWHRTAGNSSSEFVIRTRAIGFASAN